MNNEQLSKLMKEHFFSRYNKTHNKGSMAIYLKPLLELNKLCNESNNKAIIDFISNIMTESIEISRQHQSDDDKTDPTIIVFLDLKGILMRDMTTKTKKFLVMIIQFLQNTYVDTMVKTFLYNPPVFINISYKFFYRFIDPDTRKKIVIVKKNKEIISADEFCK